MVKVGSVLIYCTSTYWKLYCTTACGFCCTHERIKFVFNIIMFILSSICEHNMRQQSTSVSGPVGYYGASVDNWIQTCEGNIVSSSSRVDMPKTHFEPWRWGLCFASKCQDLTVHWCSTVSHNSRTLRYTITEVSKLVHTELTEGYIQFT